MSRLTELSVGKFDKRQRQLYDKIVSGKRGEERFSAPFHIWIRSPDFLERLEKVGSYLRGDTPLPPRLIASGPPSTNGSHTCHTQLGEVLIWKLYRP